MKTDEEKRSYQKKYQANNREKINRWAREYRQKNLEACRERDRNRDRAEYNKEYYRKNKEKIKERKRKHTNGGKDMNINVEFLKELAKEHDNFDSELEEVVDGIVRNCETVKEAILYLENYNYSEAREPEMIIYSGVAMDFLVEHDLSLEISLELAADLGYCLKDLNSQRLATLLRDDFRYNEFCEFKTDAIVALKTNENTLTEETT